MTLQNRVTPFNELVADASYRGKLMGNRGRLHDDHQTIVRWRDSKRWIICVLEYKRVRRVPMTPGVYTELFFFDEAVALAAGHRPCALCRRAQYNSFREAIVSESGGLLSADELDFRLDTERRNGDIQRRHRVQATDVPDGAMIAIGAAAYLVLRSEMFEWSTKGYRAAGSLPTGDVAMLTPPLTVMALRGGFRPDLDASASVGY